MKKIITYLFIFIFSVLILSNRFDYALGKYIQNQTPFYLSFASIGANSLASRLDAWATINVDYEADDLSEQVKYLANMLSLPVSSSRLSVEQQNGANIVKYFCHSESFDYEIESKSDSDKGVTFYTIAVICNDPATSLAEYENKIRSIWGLNWQFYYLYTGYIEALLENDAQQVILETILKTLHARTIDAYYDGNTRSMSAYSKLNHQSLRTASGANYNLQIALRPNYSQGKTYIWIGTPLIHSAY